MDDDKKNIVDSILDCPKNLNLFQFLEILKNNKRPEANEFLKRAQSQKESFFKLNESRDILIFTSELEEKINSNEFIKELYHKFFFLKRKKNNNFDLEINFDLKDKNEKNIYKWHFSLSYYYIEKIFKYIDFFLSSGPLTKTEYMIYNKCIKLMNCYYSDRIKFCIYLLNKDENNEFNKINVNNLKKSTFYPIKGSPSFNLFFKGKSKLAKLDIYKL